MKQFILFGGEGFYPDGGADDFIAWFDNIDEAIAHATELHSRSMQRTEYYDTDVEWWHLVRARTMTIIAEERAPLGGQCRPRDPEYREIRA